MNKEKLIEEMADVLENAKMDARATIGSMNHGFGMWYANALYTAGYRKQSEVHPLPCKIGDKIYEVTGEPGEQIDIDEYVVSEVGLNGVFTHGGILGRRHRHYFTYVDEGVWWFFRKEDAEAEMKRRMIRERNR